MENVVDTQRNKLLGLLYKYKDNLFHEIVGIEDVDPCLRHVELGSKTFALFEFSKIDFLKIDYEYMEYAIEFIEDVFRNDTSEMTINVTKKWSDDMVYKFNVTDEESLQKAMQFIRDNQSHYTNNAQIECFWVRER